MLPLLSAPLHELEASTIVGKYRVERTLASSSSSVTYLVTHVLLGYLAVLKVPHQAEDAVSEARALSSVQCPHVPALLETGSYLDEGRTRAYLIEEYVGGQTLTRWMATCRRMDALRAARIGLKAASALSALHRVGIIHGDIKPDNIVVEAMLETERVTLIDLGASRFAVGGMHSSTRLMATPAYMAPELRQSAPTPSTDVYSLARVLYDALSGGSVALCSPGTNIPPLSRVVPMNERLSGVLERALSNDESLRYQDAAAFAQALSELDAAELASYPGSSESLSPLHQESQDTLEVAQNTGVLASEVAATSRPESSQPFQLWSTERPCIWVLGEDAATEQVSMRGAILALRGRYEVRLMNQEACDKARLELLSGGVPPSVLVFGRSHIARREPLLVMSTAQGETMHVLMANSSESIEQANVLHFVNLDGIVSAAMGSDSIAAEIAFVAGRATSVRRCYDSLRLALADAREDLEGLRRSLGPSAKSSASFRRVG